MSISRKEFLKYTGALCLGGILSFIGLNFKNEEKSKDEKEDNATINYENQNPSTFISENNDVLTLETLDKAIEIIKEKSIYPYNYYGFPVYITEDSIDQNQLIFLEDFNRCTPKIMSNSHIIPNNTEGGDIIKRIGAIYSNTT